MTLKTLRQQLDALDGQIIKLLNQRAALTLKIGKIKAKNKISVYAPDRERQIYERISQLSKGPLPTRALKAIYREIMSGSLSLEKSLNIAYLGPAYTFTHLAALKKFGSVVNYIATNSISEVFAEVEKGRADYGVVPIENSTEGAVSHTLDMFVESDLKICSEILLEISHNLLSLSPINKIEKIYSNPQVFGQCRMWLESNLPKVELIEVSSTTKAAELASKDKTAAAIASSLAAEHYGLKIIARSIEDSLHNVTRFLIIGRTEALPTKNDKTSVMFSIKDKVGALHDMLVPFKKYGINLTKIESRPSKRKVWEYYFFVDMNGHHCQPGVSKALNELEKNCSYLKILGSYPTGNNE